ncbi:hypothetical protein V5O48_009679 [Marasmius crinis-equi]|uniref:BTB domain-containing protein n=1 Tax=Marasmius crinis-equi TaxID=585013 RepID=A0ABR3FAI6_9AGAR
MDSSPTAIAMESRQSSSSSTSSSDSGSSGYESATSSTSQQLSSSSASSSPRLFTFKYDLGPSNEDTQTTPSSISRILPGLVQTPPNTPSRAPLITQSGVRSSKLQSRSPTAYIVTHRKRSAARASSHRHVSTTRLSSPLTRCSELWFSDGNIVLISEHHFAFKVHRGVLARHSEIFADMLGVPQPMEMEIDTELEGCQHVEMAHDQADDVYHFLKSIYDGLNFMKKRRSSQFPSLLSTLRLSTKYIAPVLRQRCLDQLSADWPTTLKDWDTRETEATDDRGVYLPRNYSAHPVMAIELAREMGLMNLLPSAFYDLSRYGPSKILVGAPGLPRVMKKDKRLPETPKPVTLTQDLFVRTLRGREQAQQYMHSFIMTQIGNRTPSLDCFYRGEGGSDSRACRESFYFITLNVLRAVGGIACGRDADPLFTLGQAVDMLSRMDFVDGGGSGSAKRCGLKLCAACKADFTEDCGKARKDVWMSLPKWFGLEDVVGSSWGSDQAEGIDSE